MLVLVKLTSSTTSCPLGRVNNFPSAANSSFIYKNGVSTLVPALDGGCCSIPSALNGKLGVGTSQSSNGIDHAFFFVLSAAQPFPTVDLGKGDRTSVALGVNKGGLIVGKQKTAGGADHAFVWNQVRGRVYPLDLNRTIPAGSGWVLEDATSINDLGQIVGNGRLNGVVTSYVLTPRGVVRTVILDDNGFTPPTLSLPIGATAQWQAVGPGHSVSDATGMGLFDFTLAKDGAATFTYPGAGTYAVNEGVEWAETVVVSPTASPVGGTASTVFLIRWGESSFDLGTGFVYDVQIKRPGGGGFTSFRAGTRDVSAYFQPDAGAGTYQFRVRLRDSTNEAHSRYSPPVSIDVQ